MYTEVKFNIKLVSSCFFAFEPILNLGVLGTSTVVEVPLVEWTTRYPTSAVPLGTEVERKVERIHERKSRPYVVQIY